MAVLDRPLAWRVEGVRQAEAPSFDAVTMVHFLYKTHLRRRIEDMNVMVTQFEVDMVLKVMSAVGFCLICLAIGRGIFDRSIQEYSKARYINGMIGLLGGMFFFGSFACSFCGISSIQGTPHKDGVYVEKDQDYVKLNVPVTLSMSKISVTTEDGKKLPFSYRNVDEMHYVSGLCGGHSWRYTAHRLIIDDKVAKRKKILVAWDTEFGRETIELAYPLRWVLLLTAVIPVVLTMLGGAILSCLLKRNECSA